MNISPYIAPAAIAAPSASKAVRDPKLMNSCRQFEGQFFDMMLQEMRKTVPDDPLLGDDAHEQDIFQGMMDDDVAQQMAKHAGANDLAAEMYAQLSAKRSASVQGDPAATTNNQTPATPASQAAGIGLKKTPGKAENPSNYDAANTSHPDARAGR